jgi:hypothetical protein
MRFVSDVLKEGFGPILFGATEEFCRRTFLNNYTTIDEHDVGTDLPSEGHLVGHENHRHAFLSELAHDLQPGLRNIPTT